MTLSRFEFKLSLRFLCVVVDKIEAGLYEKLIVDSITGSFSVFQLCRAILLRYNPKYYHH